MSLLELFDHLSRLLDMQEGLVYSHAPRRLSDQDFFVADISKVQRILGWKPKIAAVEGLSLMLDWVESCFDLH
jgi:CDP-paratose 2-epimerase